MVLPELERRVATRSRVVVIGNHGENRFRRNGNVQPMTGGKVMSNQVA
jgi:hypothetical protein